MAATDSFPSLSDAGFLSGCAILQNAFEEASRDDVDDQLDWRSVQLDVDPTCLRITKTLKVPADGKRSGSLARDEDEGAADITEEDDEFLPTPIGVERLSVEYNVLLSPSYRVPILYILPPVGVSNAEDLYRLIMPRMWEAQIQSVGVAGGVSMVNHPVTDMPVYFIHPCNTAAAIEQLAESKAITPVAYLQLWLGVIGSAVGLHLPTAVAEKLMKRDGK